MKNQTLKLTKGREKIMVESAGIYCVKIFKEDTVCFGEEICKLGCVGFESTFKTFENMVKFCEYLTEHDYEFKWLKYDINESHWKIDIQSHINKQETK